MEQKWLNWARTVQSISQNGLNYAENPFDIERYEKLRTLAADIFSNYADLKHVEAVERLANEFGHATPKVDVRGACFRDQQILLIREREDGKWALPGGWADLNDAPSEAIEREIFEESGYRARVVKLAAVYDKRKHNAPCSIPHIYKHFFICEITGGEGKDSIETNGVGFYALDNLPELSTGRVTERQIQRMFEHHQHTALPADFD